MEPIHRGGGICCRAFVLFFIRFFNQRHKSRARDREERTAVPFRSFARTRRPITTDYNGGQPWFGFFSFLRVKCEKLKLIIFRVKLKPQR